jgi:hypothetical protein
MSMPSLGLAVGTAPSATVTPVLRYSRGQSGLGNCFGSGNGLTQPEDQGFSLLTEMWFRGVD